MFKFLRYIVLLVGVLSFVGMIGQEFGSNVKSIPIQDSASESLYFNESRPGFTEQKGFKPDVSVSLGSSFSSFGPGYNMFGNWIMPEFTMPVSKKFAVRAGFGYSNMFYSTPSGEGSMFQQNNLQYGTVYVSGIYSVNTKVTISGTAYKTFNLEPPTTNTVNPRALDFSNEGIMINLDYKVSDNVRFNVGVSYQRRNSYDYLIGPGGFYGYPSPFSTPGFGSPYGPGF